MQKKLQFTIMGKAKPKQSVKFTRKGIKYTPKDVVNYANWVRTCFYQAYPNHLPSMLEGYYLDVCINVFFKVPDSFSKKKREMALKGLLRYNKKPDADNCIKAQLDALNGIAYPDDKAIVDVQAHKHYAEEDYVTITIIGTKNEI